MPKYVQAVIGRGCQKLRHDPFSLSFAQESKGLSLTELGKMLNRDIAPLGRAGRRLIEEALKDEGLKARIDELRKELQGMAESLA